jgi:type III secretion system FlhB-like substrate exporter
MLLLGAIFSVMAATAVPSTAFASGGADSSNDKNGNAAITDDDNVNQVNVQGSQQNAAIDSDNKVKNGGAVNNGISQSTTQNAVNIYEDNDKIKLPKNYGGSIAVSDNDSVNQYNIQSSEQNAVIDSDNKLYGDGSNSSVDNTIVQNTEQNALNAFYDNDKIHVQKGYGGSIEVCDDDVVNQLNVQSSEQNAAIDSDNKVKNGGDGENSVANTIVQNTQQNAANIFKDNDKIMVKKSYDGDVVMVCDNDTVDQSNIQYSQQNATIDSDNKVSGDSGSSSVGNAIVQNAEQNAANIVKDNDFFKFK